MRILLPEIRSNTVRWLLFGAEALVLAFLTGMLALLVAVLAQAGLYRWNLLVLLAGFYGLGALWVMLFRVGVPSRAPRPGVPGVIRVGLGAGVLLGLGLIVATLFESNLGLFAQSVLWFGAPIAICFHLLARARTAGCTSAPGPNPGPKA